MKNDLTEDNRAIHTALENAPEVRRYNEPTLQKQDREDAKAVMKKYAPLMAEFSMTNMFKAMQDDPNNAGLNWMKTMSPFMFEKQATTIRAESTGVIDESVANGLNKYLEERGANS